MLDRETILMVARAWYPVSEKEEYLFGSVSPHDPRTAMHDAGRAEESSEMEGSAG